MEHTILLPLSGFGVGVLVGMTGMGGGLLMTPLLIIGFGLPPVIAVGTDLAYAGVTKVAGGWQHWRQGTVDRILVRDLALGSLPAAGVATVILHALQRSDGALLDAIVGKAVAVALGLAAALIVLRLFTSDAGEAEDNRRPTHRGLVIATGALGGLLVTLTSVGSGSLIMAALVMIAPRPAEQLVGTDIVHAVFLLGAGALAHLTLGGVRFDVAGLLLTGSVPGVVIGSRIVTAVPRRALQAGLAGLLATSALHLM